MITTLGLQISCQSLGVGEAREEGKGELEWEDRGLLSSVLLSQHQLKLLASQWNGLSLGQPSAGPCPHLYHAGAATGPPVALESPSSSAC